MEKHYVRNNYKLPNTVIPDIENPTGYQYSMYTFGINHKEVFLRNYENTKLQLNNSINVAGNIFDNNIVTLDPRPAVQIGYEFRN